MFTKTKTNNNFNFSFDHNPYDRMNNGEYFEYNPYQNFAPNQHEFIDKNHTRYQFYNKQQNNNSNPKNAGVNSRSYKKNNNNSSDLSNLLQILVRYYLFMVSAYKEFFTYVKKKFINEDVSLVMNRLSLMGLLFSLMLLGVVFFLAGFLVSSSLTSAKKEQENHRKHQPSETALLAGVSPSSIKMPKDVDNLVSEKHSNTGNIVMHGYKRVPTQMKRHRTQANRQIRHIPKPSHYVDQNNHYYN